MRWAHSESAISEVTLNYKWLTLDGDSQTFAFYTVPTASNQLSGVLDTQHHRLHQSKPSVLVQEAAQA